MKNQEIAGVFDGIADILEIKGDNHFRIRAYRRAARNIEGLARDIAGMSSDELRKIPGIGQDLAGKILEYTGTGRIREYEELKKAVPPGLVSLLSIPGIGPRTAKMLFEKSRVKNMADLERLARKGKLKDLPGIQAKTEKNILKSIAMIKRRSGRYPLGTVLPLAEDMITRLMDTAPVKEVYLAGSLRRWKDTVKDIDMLATSKAPKKVMRIFTRLPAVKEVLMSGPTKSSVVIEKDVQVDLRVVRENSLGAALAYFTGSKAHNIRLREMALKKKLKINEYGVFDARTGKKIGGRDEADVYRPFKFPFIPPELREDRGEIEAAAGKRLPDLVQPGSIKGDLHVHTDQTDGSQSIEEIVDTARGLKYRYVAITDHSKSLGIARGLSVERLLAQNRTIKRINRRLRGFRLLSGVELDIKSNGTLDYPDEVLRKLDIVVASIHSGFAQSKEQLTKRLVSAMKNPYVSIIAHPTGRLIGEREPYEIDMDEVLMTAKSTSTAIEINAHPLRLDLNDVYCKKAKEMGVRLVISTDAHAADQFGLMRYGIGIARRGWLEDRDVINTYTAASLLRYLKAKREKFGAPVRADT